MKLTSKEISDLSKAAQDLLNDPVEYKKFEEEHKKYFAEFYEGVDAFNEKLKSDHEKWTQDNPVQAQCDHGITFDMEAAKGLTAAEVQARWPRGWGLCPKGCGFDGIAYASAEHFLYGDW
jgi:hypothetical protein